MNVTRTLPSVESQPYRALTKHQAMNSDRALKVLKLHSFTSTMCHPPPQAKVQQSSGAALYSVVLGWQQLVQRAGPRPC